LDKDAFYFPHFSNARIDRKIRRLRKELGLEGYGIYFMILETLREQPNYNYPVEDMDLLADEFGTSEQKVRTVISNYELFVIDEQQKFFSPKMIMYLQPYLEGKERKRIGGIRGNLIRYKHITSEESKDMTDHEILEVHGGLAYKNSLPSLTESDTPRIASQSKGNETDKVNKESKQIKKRGKANIIVPSGLSLELENALKEFIDHRKIIKKPILSERPLTSMIGKIGSEFINEDHLIQCLNYAMDNQYQGVKGDYVKCTKPVEEIDYSKLEGIY